MHPRPPQEVLPQLNTVWSMPLQIVLALYFLYQVSP